MAVPTTDEMDKTTPEERYKLVALCSHCHEPHYFTGSKDRDTQTKSEVCTHCKGTQFYGMQSQRTFNPTAAKKRKARR
jgi:hypothetical protein